MKTALLCICSAFCVVVVVSSVVCRVHPAVPRPIAQALRDCDPEAADLILWLEEGTYNESGLFLDICGGRKSITVTSDGGAVWQGTEHKILYPGLQLVLSNLRLEPVPGERGATWLSQGSNRLDSVVLENCTITGFHGVPAAMVFDFRTAELGSVTLVANRFLENDVSTVVAMTGARSLCIRENVADASAGYVLGLDTAPGDIVVY